MLQHATLSTALSIWRLNACWAHGEGQKDNKGLSTLIVSKAEWPCPTEVYSPLVGGSRPEASSHEAHVPSNASPACNQSCMQALLTARLKSTEKQCFGTCILTTQNYLPSLGQCVMSSETLSSNVVVMQQRCRTPEGMVVIKPLSATRGQALDCLPLDVKGMHCNHT